ncbi:MAG: hypothetical protein K2M47_07280 [Clostridiales bacterium]|nr:hypothetical protein [Clostridiales bacterium]
MQDNNVEQAEKSVSKIGKFNTAEDLLAAYNALESEFTKRCQLVKQLQAELDFYHSAQAQEQIDEQTADAERDNVEQQAQTPEINQPVHEAEKDEKSADNIPPAPVITADDVLNEILQNACEYAEVLSTIPEIMSACIASYKQRLIRPQPASAPSGCAVIVPSKRPRTLSEAKRLADALLEGN